MLKVIVCNFVGKDQMVLQNEDESLMQLHRSYREASKIFKTHTYLL